MVPLSMSPDMPVLAPSVRDPRDALAAFVKVELEWIAGTAIDRPGSVTFPEERTR